MVVLARASGVSFFEGRALLHLTSPQTLCFPPPSETFYQTVKMLIKVIKPTGADVLEVVAYVALQFSDRKWSLP